MLLYGTLSVLLILGVLAFERGGDPPHGVNLVAAVAYLNAAAAFVFGAALSGFPIWMAAIGATLCVIAAVFRVIRFRRPPYSRRRR